MGGFSPVSDLLDDIRTSAAAVAGRARLVRIDDDALRHLATTFDPTPPAPLPEEDYDGPVRERAMGVLGWNAVNFGSGWFPLLDKEPQMSGARTLATRWRRFFAQRSPDARFMVDATRADAAAVFGQSTGTQVVELLDLFATAWNEVGELLLERYDGEAINLVEECGGSAARLAATLGELPSWHDVSTHDGDAVPLYKRAQIVCSHLAQALSDDGRSGTGLGHFVDLDRLTAFADNLVPHVLRHHRVMLVDDEVAERIEAEDLFDSGEPAEVELRAVAVHAVEELVARLAELHPGTHPTAATVDHLLWRAGQDPAIKARPRHRCRTTFY